jgi:hypothetical protein
MYTVDTLEVIYTIVKILVLVYFIMAVVAFFFINRIRNEVITMHEEIFYMNQKLNKLLKLYDFREKNKSAEPSDDISVKRIESRFTF